MPFGLAFIVGQLALGGAEQQLYHPLSGLDRSRFRLLVIGLRAGPVPTVPLLIFMCFIGFYLWRYLIISINSSLQNQIS